MVTTKEISVYVENVNLLSKKDRLIEKSKLSDTVLSDLKRILSQYGCPVQVSDNADDLAHYFNPIKRAYSVIDSNHPDQVIVIQFNSATDYWQRRDRYFGIPTCCVKRFIALIAVGRAIGRSEIEPIPFLTNRCHKHANLTAEEWVDLVNKHRIHPVKQTLTSGRPDPASIFLKLVPARPGLKSIK